MKALVYEKANTLDAFAIELRDVPEPIPRDDDVLVDVRAVGINPGETFYRKTRSAEAGGRVLLGWEFAGIVVGKGSRVDRFKVGDRVFGTGDMRRDGAWAQRVTVDHRIVAAIPDGLSFTDAASLPIGTLTAWEALFRVNNTLPEDVKRVLIIGGAGGVGSMAIQLLKAKTKAFVIATASRLESRTWCLKLGADLVIDHTGDVVAQLADAGIESVDMVLSTANSAGNLPWIAKLLRPYGHVSIADGSPGLDASALMLKAASLHLEMVFSKILHDYEVESQGEILADLAGLIDKGRVKPIATTRFGGLTVETMKAAHELLEARRTVGKVVITT